MSWTYITGRSTRSARKLDAAIDSERRAIHEALATNYRQLVLNYEGRRGHELAEDFYIGEMETQRKKMAIGSRFGWQGLVNLYMPYRVLSVYGSNVTRAATWLLLIVLVIAPVGFMHLGFDVAKEALPASEATVSPAPVDWNLLWPFAGDHVLALKPWLHDYGQALQLTFSIITFQRDRFFVPLDGWGRAWLMLMTVALAGQAALTLFAVRRRFKR